MQELRFLRVAEFKPSRLPISRLPALTHLEIMLHGPHEGLGSLLRQMRRLQSFSIIIAQSYLSTPVLEEMAAVIPYLPNLVALAIHGSVVTADIVLFCWSLRDCTRLRRMYWNHLFSPSELRIYLQAIAALPKLEIFHLSVAGDQLDACFIARLCRSLPQQLSVLSLYSPRTCPDDRSTFSGLWTYLTGLSFLNVQYSRCSKPSLTAQNVVCGSKALQLIGWDGQLHEVTRLGAELVVEPAWSEQKKLFFEVEDFGCECWNWMMRHLFL
ncbi:hypothetical protein DAEQUDRAFT_733820 [Daedalea quercina L-15889]|uniref:F-box domain-containing protein n=1 Tax=Daedalea quercina L-15889 TaxID=1314783 RepID=A0A165KQA3_9APHY|nr:hypothetical protein DAEQUDRAFT_733820 [Daedalea quercina L-15889]